MMKRAVRFTKHNTPNSVRVVARRVMGEAYNAKLRLSVPVESRSEFGNVYHCTIRKTASQWIKALLSDPVVYRYSGLLPYDPRPHKWRYPQPCPRGRVVSTLFVSYNGFMNIPKPDPYRVFFVIRDPRDIVVSSYFSYRSSHTAMGDVLEVRKVLQEKPKKEGMLYLIDHLAGKGTFRSLRAWAKAPEDGTVGLFKYEDLTGERQADEVARLMRHCGFPIPPDELTALLSRYSFSRMRSTRASAGPLSHYRRGAHGDWVNHFDDDIHEAFVAATGDLVKVLGYPESDQVFQEHGAQQS
ncbi:sulfotransferase domain-containing protein [Micromonospora sp. WMMD1102]|uniref:sulfotransferase domain-containing protein n=1 Tax=Micromonospora sp. WMMD1102 TaxID=3016105 RepID=UPI00241504D0|nr:sulfotransferase domain-containing protein [Micromonospora sp. WMMD1102]MDG4787899.1 sulfotransferase domain-containing protein [Micromonospora sp. WMMD1102]